MTKDRQPLTLNRDNSISDRYRDYSPGEVVIQTPSIPFSGINLKEVRNMFSLNNDDFNNHLQQLSSTQNKSRVSQKRNLNGQQRSTQAATANKNSFYSKAATTHSRPFDTSKYKVKTLKHSKSTRSKHPHHRTNRNGKLDGQLTYNFNSRATPNPGDNMLQNYERYERSKRMHAGSIKNTKTAQMSENLNYPQYMFSIDHYVKTNDDLASKLDMKSHISGGDRSMISDCSGKHSIKSIYK